MAETIHVQLTYALPERQYLIELDLQAGSTILDAIRASKIIEQQAEIDLDTVKVGIYSKKKELDFVLREHDRIELYRPLIADPKEARRKRANKPS